MSFVNFVKAALLLVALYTVLVVFMSLLGHTTFLYSSSDETETLVPRYEILRLSLMTICCWFSLLAIFFPERRYSAAHFVLVSVFIVIWISLVYTSFQGGFYSQSYFVLGSTLIGASVWAISRTRVQKIFKRR